MVDLFRLQELLPCGIYFLLFLYFKEVVPGEYGPQRSCWFFARPSYWRNRLHRKQGRDSYGIDSNYSQVELAKMTVARRDSCVEAPVDDETPAVRLHNLRKVFSSVKKVAVHGLTLAFYRNQVSRGVLCRHLSSGCSDHILVDNVLAWS